jgi:hypothetical protein
VTAVTVVAAVAAVADADAVVTFTEALHDLPPEIPADAVPAEAAAAPAPRKRADPLAPAPGMEACELPDVSAMTRDEILAVMEEERLLHQRRLLSLRNICITKFKRSTGICYTGFRDWMNLTGLPWVASSNSDRSGVLAAGKQPAILVAGHPAAGDGILNDAGLRWAAGEQRERLAGELEKVRTQVVDAHNRGYVTAAVRNRILLAHGMRPSIRMRHVHITIGVDIMQPAGNGRFSEADVRAAVTAFMASFRLPGQDAPPMIAASAWADARES